MAKSDAVETTTGPGGETHQSGGEGRLTTNQGVPIADNENGLKVGARGPMLLEDFIFREKLTHFDHERIPERIVHARGYGAHGFFQPYPAAARLSKAAFLQDPSEKTEVFVRFSTVVGNKGSADLARDARGFATKFYTREGNYDLVANNIPVFFIQDPMKFPDLVHSVKPEPDRHFPQASAAHDTFWDFVSLVPEATNMVLWAMSDRAIPRSFRMMEGFGVHTFKLIDAAGTVRFVKFHWRPVLGTFAVVWDEAVKIMGADPDFHRRDLWDAIQAGDFPEYELSVQVMDEATANALDFDILDATKFIPEEIVPLTPIGKMTLDRTVDNHFAETEQVAFCPANLVPGIDFTDDPLLHGRLFSYLDTQLKRLGGPNFTEIPINRPRCPFGNFQRDGHMRMTVPKGRVAYEPNSLSPTGPREDARAGFTTVPRRVTGDTVRARPESFADHYSQARQFWRSMSEPEKRHIVGAFAFELGKVETVAIRRRMLGNLTHVADDLATRVAAALGMEGQAEVRPPAAPPKDLPPSPSLSLVAKAPKTIRGRKIGVLVTDGVDDAVVVAVAQAAAAEGAKVQIVAPKVGGVKTAAGKHLTADHALAGGPSVLFDAVVVACSDAGAAQLAGLAPAVAWVADAFAHLKVIGHVAAARPLLDAARVVPDAGVVPIDAGAVPTFLAVAKEHRIWDREPKVLAPV